MKKRILTLVLALAVLLSAAVPALAAPFVGHFVIDQAGLLSQEEALELEELAREISGDYDCGVYLAAVDNYTLYGSSPEAAAIAIYEQNNWGVGAEHDGFLLLLSMDDRDFWLMSHGHAGNYAMNNPVGRELLQDAFLPYFGDNDWFRGFRTYITESEDFLQAAASGTPMGSSGRGADRKNPLISYGMAAVVSAIIALCVCMGFKRQMKTAVAQAAADNYVPEDGVEISRRSDRYTHTTTVRTRIERDNDSSSGSSGSSGGGYSGGGGKF